MCWVLGKLGKGTYLRSSIPGPLVAEELGEGTCHEFEIHRLVLELGELWSIECDENQLSQI